LSRLTRIWIVCAVAGFALVVAAAAILALAIDFLAS
jgi:hypothetical protein